MNALDKRQPLMERGMTGEWTDFEAKLFKPCLARVRGGWRT